MKTIKLFSLLVATGFLTMSMGFPTDLADTRINKEAEACNEAIVTTVSEIKPGKVVMVDAVEDEPVEAMPMYAIKSDKITVKVFDVKGALVLNQEVNMNDFLAKNNKVNLPGGSTFVMFHANTAYYFLEAGLSK